MFYGFEALYDGMIDTPDWHKLQARSHYDALLRLCEAVGTVRMEDPETYNLADEPPDPLQIETLLTGLDRAFGFHLEFPNPYPKEVGLATERGVASQRAIHSIYQAWRVKKLTERISKPRILETGAGLGRAAYYAHKFELLDYTIIDIPMTNVAQSYFLSLILECGFPLRRTEK